MDASALYFWTGYERELTTLGLYAIGLALYALLVWSMCAVISRRNFLFDDTDDEPTPGMLAATGRFLAWIFLFPTVATGYFLTIAIALFFLAKNQTGGQILLVSISLVAGIRIAAWLNEETAREVAKIVPIGLLGVLIVEPGYLSFTTTLSRFSDLPSQLPLLGRYFLVLVLMELASKPLQTLMVRRERRKRREEKETRRVPLTVAAKDSAPRRPL